MQAGNHFGPAIHTKNPRSQRNEGLRKESELNGDQRYEPNLSLIRNLVERVVDVWMPEVFAGG